MRRASRVGVVGQWRAGEARLLPLARSCHPRPDFLARLAGEFLVLDARYLDALRVSNRSSSEPLMRF